MGLEPALGVASYLGQLGRLGSTDLFQLPPHRLGQMLMNEHQVVGGAAPKTAEVAARLNVGRSVRIVPAEALGVEEAHL